MFSSVAKSAVAGIAACALACASPAQTAADAVADPIFKSGDIVALVGGEDVVLMRDAPEFELLVLRQPGLSGVKFRNLAFEGDTVFEQFRDLNFPSWEEQMRSVGATVVVAQFGKMESLAGREGVPAFTTAYERFLDRLAGGGRRVLMIAANPPKGAPPDTVAPYNTAAQDLARRRGWSFLDTASRPLGTAIESLGFAPRPNPSPELADLVRRKNTLWFHYWRPQNWAFLHGDRTEQQSSRDHRDPTKRWFPEEMKQWLPLVAAAESQIQLAIDADRKP